MNDVRCVQVVDGARGTEAEELLTDSSKAKKRVLIVDDEAPIAFLIAEIIRAFLEWEAVQVHSAEAAIEALQQGEFSLVVSDIRMPGVGGFALLEWIQEHRPALRNRFLFVSGCPGGRAADLTLAKCGVPVVTKPFSCPQLVQRCMELLAKDKPCDFEIDERCCGI